MLFPDPAGGGGTVACADGVAPWPVAGEEGAGVAAAGVVAEPGVAAEVGGPETTLSEPLSDLL
jgi:hypothetical protein